MSSFDQGYPKVVVRRYTDNELSVECNNTEVLEEIKRCLDGYKVRRVNKVIVPQLSIDKVRRYSNDIDYLDDTKEVLEGILRKREVRLRNVRKIKETYNNSDDMKFNYNYRGAYDDIMKCQKATYNVMMYATGAAILNDPGTGKTGPMLWAIDSRIEKGQVKKCLFITLATLKTNVLAEVITELPHRSGVVLNSNDHADKVLNKKFKLQKKNVDYDIYIASYGMMDSMVKLFGDDYFDMVILDEAHSCQSPTSNQTKAIVGKFELAKYKYISTGTLNANNLLSYFMPYRFLGPDFVVHANYYAEREQSMITVDRDGHIWKPKAGAVSKTARVIGSCAIMFKKEECLDLPGITYTKIECDMAGDQKKAYLKAKKDMVVKIDEFCDSCEFNEECSREIEECVNEKAFIDNALVLAGKLRQIASGFYINSWVDVDEEEREQRYSETFHFKSNPKVKAIMEILGTLPKDKKVIIWCTFTASVEGMAEAIAKKFGKGSVITCYGDQDTYDQVQKFRDPDIRFIVANTTKMGTGQNIQFSDYSFFLDNSYSFITREQVIGRQYRKGQKNIVSIYDFVCRDTIDEEIIEALIRKTSLSITLSEFAKIIS